jgi:hypothetical protein
LCACSNGPGGTDGAGERTAHVAEEFGLEQRLGNGAAVQRDEASVSARAVWWMARAHDLFARASFAGDEIVLRTRDRCRAAETSLHRPAAAQDAAELVSLLELRAQDKRSRTSAGAAQCAFEHVHQLVELERLVQ